MRLGFALLFLFVVCLQTGVHGVIWMVPLNGMEAFEDGDSSPGNLDLDNATHWDDTNRLTAVYGELVGNPHYYSFDIHSPSATVVIKLYRASNSDEEGFTPGFTIMGPGPLGLDDYNFVPTPNTVEIPIGYTAVTRMNAGSSGLGIINALPPYGYFELDTVVLENVEDGRYFVAVFSYDRVQVGGHFALSVGEVEWFFFTEYILGPVYALAGWTWGGQNVGLALITVWVTFLGGIAVLSWQGCYPPRHSPRTYFNWVTCIGGFVVMSSAFVVVQQLLYAILTIDNIDDINDIWITVFWILCPLILGWVTVFLGLMSHVNLLVRFLLVLIFLLSLLVWSGYYGGPLLVFIGALLPANKVPWHKCLPWFKPPHEGEGGLDDSDDDIDDTSKPLIPRVDDEDKIDLGDVGDPHTEQEVPLDAPPPGSHDDMEVEMSEMAAERSGSRVSDMSGEEAFIGGSSDGEDKTERIEDEDKTEEIIEDEDKTEPIAKEKDPMTEDQTIADDDDDATEEISD
mmetsp:Transcript_9139/g.12280  ORF Transcript_9139/g.12280 Transcript_9139/m.12280 type:complete len:512 (-) Transcript_9139:68-1603(-)|eukprot:CAMPEP_0201478384 /NCGR_PEP_ID=MMETSP0151_2-20130828/3240_1 /ASSEMBLY_ACC=CAM_ASM_000257 /TAXON_ID=200890 /ORGANISM="Paramoeba atlantica, Strain 621/1 / CCAP 1560/9" /LENGTH=511 /DNA_ID=CAMNT_0047859445 /DNA_START=58 /DNA_END=1593 /DNA_ORIENTATION=-